MCGKCGISWELHLKAEQEVKGYSSAARMSTAMILGLPALALLVGPASDNSQRSIKSSAEILGDTSAFSSPSASGSRDCIKKESQDGGQGGERKKGEDNLNNASKETERWGLKVAASVNRKSLVPDPNKLNLSASDTTHCPC